MDIRARKWIATLVTGALGVGLGPGIGARAEAKGSRKHADLFGVIGFGTGFGLGTLAGFGQFDEATNSDKKIWTSALVSAGIGTVIGYAWGAHIDHKQEAARSLDVRLDRAIEAGRAAVAVAEVAAAECETLPPAAGGDAGASAPTAGDCGEGEPALAAAVLVACATEPATGVAAP